MKNAISEQPEPLLQRYAVVNAADQIINIVLWDGQSDWHPGAGLTVRLAKEDDIIFAATEE